MNGNEYDDDDLNQFLQQKNYPADNNPASIAIVRDLVLSRIRLTFVYVVGSALGYLLSLLICAQCAIGLSHLSWKLASYLHAIPDPWCPILCGAVFGISPTIVSVLYLSRFQHRFLIFKMGWLPALVPIAGSFSLLLFEDPHSWEWRVLWILSAIFTPYFVELSSAIALRQGKWTQKAREIV